MSLLARVSDNVAGNQAIDSATLDNRLTATPGDKFDDPEILAVEDTPTVDGIAPGQAS